MPGVCPAWKATGNAALVEAGPPSPVPLPPPSALRLLPVPKVRGLDTHADSPLVQRILGHPRRRSHHKRPPKAPADVPQPLSGLHCSLHPGTTSSWWLPGGFQGHAREETITLKRPQGWHSLRTAWSSSQEHRSTRKCRQPNCQPAQQKCCFQPNSWAPSTPAQGLLPSPH